MPPTFLRRNWNRLSRLGKKRRKKQVWRSPHGRHNKMREKRKGYPAVVEIGYKQKVKDEKMVLVNNLRELLNLGKGNVAILGKVGNKKKIELVKVAKEKGIKIYNLNLKKFDEKMEKQTKEKEAKKVPVKKEEKHSKKEIKSGSEQVQASSNKNIGREEKKK